MIWINQLRLMSSQPRVAQPHRYAASAIAFSILLAACASHPQEDGLAACLGAFPAQGEPRDSTNWVPVTGADAMVSHLRQTYHVDDKYSKWFSSSTGSYLLCRERRHYTYGGSAATLYVPDGTDWKVEEVITILN